MKIEYAIRKRDSLKNEIQSLVDWTIRSKLSQSEYLERRCEIYDSALAISCPQWVRQYVEGYEKCQQETIDRLTEFAYCIPLKVLKTVPVRIAYLSPGTVTVDYDNGVFFVLPITSEAYRAISPHVIASGHDSGIFPSGIFWRHEGIELQTVDDSKIWFADEKSSTRITQIRKR